MSRYIDADALIAQYKGDVLTAQVDYAEGVRDVIEDIKNAPSIDIVRCKECKHWLNDHICTHWSGYYGTIETIADNFCSYGERKEEEVMELITECLSSILSIPASGAESKCGTPREAV